MQVKFFDPGLNYVKHRNEMRDAMDYVLAKGDLILRGDVEEFEQKFADYVGTKYAVGVASGTDALILSLKAAGVRAGDEVIAPSYSFRATVEAIHHVGAKPVLVDLGEDWQKYITPHTKAVIPAHIAGEVLDWEPVEGITMIEDACQAVGAAPVKGLTACYSFYPAKILGCYGDGGAIATNDKQIYDHLKIMRNHYKGDWGPYGYNSRLDNLQAAVLNIKLKYLPEAIKRRKEIAVKYDEGLATLAIGRPVTRETYQDYIIVLETPEDVENLSRHLSLKGIETMRNGYPYPGELTKGPKTERYEACSLRLPCHPDLTDEQVQYVIDAINEPWI
jgi:dTDP-4-amino-4,6-dideoxygalactose transaminase